MLLTAVGFVLPKRPLNTYMLCYIVDRFSFSDAGSSIRIRGSQPCGATMRGARSDQAAAAASLKRSTPRPGQTSLIRGRPARSCAIPRPVSGRQFSFWTTSRAEPALSDADQSAPPQFFVRIRIEKPARLAPAWRRSQGAGAEVWLTKLEQ